MVMDNRPILFLDSGIGGIPYCRHFHRRNPGETIMYLADRRHFPYGGRERAELIALLFSLLEKLIILADPKIAVIACNTATVSALPELRERFPGLPFVGTVPAVKPAVLATRTGKVGVLATGRSIDDPYIRRLAAEHGGCEICGIAAPALVELVERRIHLAGEKEKRGQAREYLARFREAGADVLVLGCTHFLFLLEEFRLEAAPDIAVFDSVDGISRRVEFLLDENLGAFRNGGVAHNGNENRLLVTGRGGAEDPWQYWADELGFRLSLMEET
jgi:glutamate racemase